jgi:hypothetical protein
VDSLLAKIASIRDRSDILLVRNEAKDLADSPTPSQISFLGRRNGLIKNKNFRLFNCLSEKFLGRYTIFVLQTYFNTLNLSW